MASSLTSGGQLNGKRRRKKSIIIAGEGDPCPRCGKPMQIRAYADVVYEQLRATSFYTRWFCCMDKTCKTTLVMLARYKAAKMDSESPVTFPARSQSSLFWQGPSRGSGLCLTKFPHHEGERPWFVCWLALQS
jgi:hypothetical protein